MKSIFLRIRKYYLLSSYNDEFSKVELGIILHTLIEMNLKIKDISKYGINLKSLLFIIHVDNKISYYQYNLTKRFFELFLPERDYANEKQIFVSPKWHDGFIKARKKWLDRTIYILSNNY